jgi:acetyl esterase/lipase
MKPITLSVAVVLTVLLAFTAAQEQKSPPQKSRGPRRQTDAPGVVPSPPHKSLVFKKTPQGELKLHFFFPPDWKPDDRRPAIVFWFGGGFVGGSPSQFYAKSEYFAGRGLVCAAAEYRVKNAHGTGLDKCVEDARSAIRWVKQHAGEYGVDPEKVIASGGSAGGTLSLLVALATGPDAEDDPKDVSPRPCAMVLFNPAQGEAVTSRVDPELCDKPRLLEQIAGLDRPQPGQPPAIVFFGTSDRLLVPSQKFCEQAIGLGNRCELWTAEGQGHGFFNRSPWHEATLFEADKFLASLGYLEGPPTIETGRDAVLKRQLPKGP